MVFFIFPEIADEIFVHKIDENLIDVELEGHEQERREDVLTFNTTYNLLDKSYLIQLPLYCLRVLIKGLFLCRLLLRHFALQCCMLSQGKDIQTFLPIDFKDLLKQVT